MLKFATGNESMRGIIWVLIDSHQKENIQRLGSPQINTMNTNLSIKRTQLVHFGPVSEKKVT